MKVNCTEEDGVIVAEEYRCTYIDNFYTKLENNYLKNCINTTHTDAISIAALGVAAILNKDKYSYKSSWVRSTYPFLDINKLPEDCPALNRVLDFLVSSGLYQLSLSKVGQVIGVKMLENTFGELPLNKFIF